MEANKTVLNLKYVRIIAALAAHENISYEEALKMFYKSRTSRMIAEGVGDLHCLSADYLVDEILIELRTEEKLRQEQVDRLKAYQEALQEVMNAGNKDCSS